MEQRKVSSRCSACDSVLHPAPSPRGQMNPVNSISRRDFVKSSVLSAALPLKAPETAKSVGYRSPNRAERGIKVGCSVVLWTQGAQASLSEALRGVAQAGYQWVEGSAEDLLSYEDRPAEFREMLGEFGLGWVTATLDANCLIRPRAFTSSGAQSGRPVFCKRWMRISLPSAVTGAGLFMIPEVSSM